MPALVVIATVAEPVATRISAAADLSSSGGADHAYDEASARRCDVALGSHASPLPPPAGSSPPLIRVATARQPSR